VEAPSQATVLGMFEEWHCSIAETCFNSNVFLPSVPTACSKRPVL